MTDLSTPAARLRLQFLVAFAFIATVGMWANLMYYSWFAEPLGWKYPDNTFQCVQVSRFSDFYNMVEVDRGRDPYYANHPAAVLPPGVRKPAYPPLAQELFHLLSLLVPVSNETNTAGVRKGQDLALWLFLGIPFCAFPLLAWRWLSAGSAPVDGVASSAGRGSVGPWLTVLLVLIGFDLAYPMLFTIDRGNLELYSFILISLFAWWMNESSGLRRLLAVAAVGAAAALKIYPLVFALLYVKQRRWKEALGVGAVAVACSLVCYQLFEGGLVGNIHAHWHIVHDIARRNSEDVVWATRNSSSLFSLVYLGLRAVLHSPPAAEWFRFHAAPILWGFSTLTVGVLLWRRLSFARLLLGVCCLAILATPESPDYKLLLLYPAAIAVMVEGGGSRLFNLLFVAGVGLLLVPKNWIMIFDEVSYGSLVNPLLVLCLLVLAVAAGWSNVVSVAKPMRRASSG